MRPELGQRLLGTYTQIQYHSNRGLKKAWLKKKSDQHERIRIKLVGKLYSMKSERSPSFRRFSYFIISDTERINTSRIIFAEFLVTFDLGLARNFGMY